MTLCFGGSILAPDEPDIALIREVAQTLRMLKSRKHEVLVVVGGGGPSRKYIEAARALKAPSASCDTIGIGVTHLNARLLIAALGDFAEGEPITTFGEAIKVMLRGKVPVMGGIKPGQTTGAVAAMLANTSKSELLVFFTDVDGIYTADPKLDPKAKKFEMIKARQLVSLAGGQKIEPGMRAIIDPVGVRLIERGRIRTLVLGKREIKRLQHILNGAKHSGTLILPE